jgi:hypothetical protein
MADLSHESQEMIFDHLTTVVMDCGTEGIGHHSDIIPALRHDGMYDPRDLFDYTVTIIDQMEYWSAVEKTKSKSVLTPLSTASKRYLKWFIQWLTQVIAPIYGTRHFTVEQYLGLTRSEFNAY